MFERIMLLYGAMNTSLHAGRANTIERMDLGASVGLQDFQGYFIDGFAYDTRICDVRPYDKEGLFGRTVLLVGEGYKLWRAASVGQLEHTRTVGSVVINDLAKSIDELADLFDAGAIVTPYILLEKDRYSMLPGAALMISDKN